MNDTKKVGRPKTFDEHTALQAAVDTFWVKGYDGASMKDLTSAMGINSPSLYATYGDKETLFIKAIEHYMGNVDCSPLDAFENEPDIQKAVYAFFEAIVTYVSEHEKGSLGCFLSSCVVTCAETVEGVKPLLQTAITESEKRIAKRFDQAKNAGQLPKNFPSKQRARLMFDLRQGPVFRARAGLPAKSIRQDMACWAHAVLN
ncbi:MAG: TetR/AcrR family transcriptional regulator [Pseudomonadota bacterium]